MNRSLTLSAFAGALLFAFAAPAATISGATVTLLDSSEQNDANDANVYAAGFAANTPFGANWSPNDPTITPPPNSIDSIYKSPFQNLAIQPGGSNGPTYFSVGGATSGGEGASSPATLTLAAPRSSLDILWGSIDSYNTLKFFNASSVLISSITGGDIITAFTLGGSSPSFEQIALLNIVLPDAFTSITFFSEDSNGTDIAAFEFALAPVPLPAAAWMLISALAGLGFVSRKRITA